MLRINLFLFVPFLFLVHVTSAVSVFAYFSGSSPKRFAPSVPLRQKSTNIQTAPIRGTKPTKIHHPRRLVSCSLLTVTAKKGISVTRPKTAVIKRKLPPPWKEAISIPITTTPISVYKSWNNQNSLGRARPEKVAYLLVTQPITKSILSADNTIFVSQE